MIAVAMFGPIGVVVSLFGRGGMLGRGYLLEEMVHPMGRGGRQEKNEYRGDAQV